MAGLGTHQSVVYVRCGASFCSDFLSSSFHLHRMRFREPGSNRSANYGPRRAGSKRLTCTVLDVLADQAIARSRKPIGKD